MGRNLHLQLSLGRHLRAGLLDLAQHAVSALLVGVADIDFHLHPAGNTVHRSGIDVALAHGGAGVDRAGGERAFFDGEHDLRGGTKSVLAIGHQHAAGVASLALDRDAQRSGRGDAGDNARPPSLPSPAADPARYATRQRRHSSHPAGAPGRVSHGSRLPRAVGPACCLRNLSGARPRRCPGRRSASGYPGSPGRSASAPPR